MPVSKLALNDGTQTPWIAFGTGTALFNKDAADAVTLAIHHGFTHLDGAQLYANETSLGAGIAASARPRSELYITTKLGTLAQGETPKSALKQSLKKLGVAYVDMYLVHAPKHHGNNKLKEVWKGMEEARMAGLTKSIGVSNFAAEHLENILEAATIMPAVNQIEAHPYVWKDIGPTLAIHAKHGIVTSSYGGLSPLFRGERGPLDPVVEQVRKRLESTRGSTVSNGQVLHKWLQQKGLLVVTTTSKVERIKEYVDAENVPELTPEEIQLIDTTGAKLHRRYFPQHWPPE